MKSQTLWPRILLQRLTDTALQSRRGRRSLLLRRMITRPQRSH